MKENLVQMMCALRDQVNFLAIICVSDILLFFDILDSNHENTISYQDTLAQYVVDAAGRSISYRRPQNDQ